MLLLQASASVTSLKAAAIQYLAIVAADESSYMLAFTARLNHADPHSASALTASHSLSSITERGSSPVTDDDFEGCLHISNLHGQPDVFEESQQPALQ